MTCREKDESLVKKSADQAKKQYKEKSGRDVEIEVKKGLNKESSGGIILAGHGERIKINNTLDERLRLLEESVSTIVARVIEREAFSLTTPRPPPSTDASRDPTRALWTQRQQKVL